MKRRKWWLIALSLALLAACVVVWRQPAPTVFGFMAQAKLKYVGVSQGRVIEFYELPFGSIGAAEQEFRGTGWSKRDGSGQRTSPTGWTSSPQLVYSRATPEVTLSFSGGYVETLWITRPPRIHDYLRAVPYLGRQAPPRFQGPFL
jgi:hypothetical protein